MFKNLTEFSFKRTWKEALGFYLAYFFLGMMIAFFVGALMGINSAAQGGMDQIEHQASAIGITVVTIYCLGIACLLLAQKKLYKKFS